MTVFKPQGRGPSLPRNKKLPKRRDTDIIDNRPRPGDKDKPGKKGGKAGGGKKRGSDHFGSHHGYGGVSKKQTERLAQATINKEIRNLREQRRQVNRDTRNQTNKSKSLYQRGVGDLNYVNDEVTDFLGSTQQKNQQMYADQRSQQEQASAALQQSLGDTYSGAQSGAAAELARLGISGGGNFGGLIADQANAQGVAQQSGANALSTMDLASGNASQMGQLLQGMAAGSHISNIGRNLNAYNDRQSTILQNRTDQMDKVNQAIRDTNDSRNDIYLQLLQQLQQTGWGQYLQGRQLKRRKK